MNDTLSALAQEPYEHRGIIHSEIALILMACRKFGITRLIETGRARAQSTYLLSKYMPDVVVHSVEMRDSPDADFGRERVKDVSNVRLYEGDGSVLVPEIAAQSVEPTAILCDGPKGAGAVAIVQNCFDLPHVLIAFVHDMRRLDKGGPSPHREIAVRVYPNVKFSDDPALVAASSWMDAEVVKAGGPCGPDHEAVFGSYGPTLGVFANSNKQRI